MNCPQPSPARTTVYTRALHRACEMLGSVEALARRLNVSELELERWLRGIEQPPEKAFLAAVDIALSPPSAANE